MMIKIECFEGHEVGTAIAYISRKGKEHRYEISPASQARLAKQVHYLIVKEKVTLRPFLGGLGWVAEIKEIEE